MTSPPPSEGAIEILDAILRAIENYYRKRAALAPGAERGRGESV